MVQEYAHLLFLRYPEARLAYEELLNSVLPQSLLGPRSGDGKGLAALPSLSQAPQLSG